MADAWQQQPPGQSSEGRLADDVQDPKESVSGLFVANQTFATTIDGVPTVIHKGQDRVRAGHSLLDANPQFFDPVELGVTYDVESASAEPGSKRGARQGESAEPTKDDLMERAQALDVEGRSGMSKAELEKAVAKAERSQAKK